MSSRSLGLLGAVATAVALLAACAPTVPLVTGSPQGPSIGETPASLTPRVSASAGPILADARDLQLFVFASGPDCFSLQITSGQPFNLRFPSGWTLDEVGHPGCLGPMYGSSIGAVRDTSGQQVARSGDVVRVAGERVDSTGEEFVPIFAVESIEATHLTLPAALELAFRDEDSPFIRVRDRAPLQPCGLMVFKQFVTGGETDVDSRDASAAVRRCVWGAYEAGSGAEYVIQRESIDAGHTTRIVRVLPSGAVELWTLLRHSGNEPEAWHYEECAGLEEGEPSGGAPTFEPFDCRLED